MVYWSNTLRYLTNLTQLSFAYNKLDSDGIKELCCSFDCLNELKELKLYGNTVYDEGLIILSKHFCFISNLTLLDVSGIYIYTSLFNFYLFIYFLFNFLECSIGDKGVIEMCSYFSDIKSLEKLFICSIYNNSL